MATSTNSGKYYEIRNITLNSSTDTPIDFNSRFINSCIIRCRTNIDLYLRFRPNDADYFTIPAGSSFTLDCASFDANQGGYIIGYLRSASTSPVVEVLATF